MRSRGFVIGYPEAEAEANNRSELQLFDVFEDYFDILQELKGIKFIVAGRKGNGKSALGQFIVHQAKVFPNQFAKFIKKDHINLEKVVQTGVDDMIDYELLFKWIILVQFLGLISENQAIQEQKEIQLLKNFLKVNAGFVNIDNYQLDNVIREKGAEIELEQLKRLGIALNLSNKISTKSHKAPFYKFLPHLQEVVVKLLAADFLSGNGNQYQIVFDDLDIDFKVSNSNQIDYLTKLIRVVKGFNNDVFADNNLNAKIIVLLRDDILKELENSGADTGKIINTYSIVLNWYEEYKPEDETSLKRFIDKRIESNFKRLGYDLPSHCVWNSLVSEEDFVGKSGFKYILDHTFFRPRDIVLFFNDFSKYDMLLPLAKRDVNTLLGYYANLLATEIRNELLAHLDKDEIEDLFLALYELSSFENFTYDELLDEIEAVEMSISAKQLVAILFNYSIIGNIDLSQYPPKVYFKYREKNIGKVSINENASLIFHLGFKVYLRNFI